MMNRNTCVLFLASLLVAILPAFAQPLAPSAQPTLGALTEESVLTLANIDSGVTTSIEPNTLAALQAGALELRQSVQYDPARATLQITGFAVAPGSPLPTPVPAQALNIVWSYTVQVSQVRLPLKPKNRVAFIGTINTAAISPFGDLVGSPMYFSAGFTAATGDGVVTDFSMITTNIAGTATLYSPSGSGNARVTVPTSASVSPVAVAGPKGTQNTSGSFQLDGTKSSDPTGGALTYQWAYMPSQGQTVTITGDTTATASVVIPQNAFSFGDYTFLLTVTNSAGLSSTDTVTVNYVDPNDHG